MIIRGNFAYASSLDELVVKQDKYLKIKDGRIVKFYDNLDEIDSAGEEILDYKDLLIIPAFNDLHTHAPQYPNRGIGFDKELMPWLNTYTFTLESKYKDSEFAKKVYSLFVEKMKKSGTMRFVAFATLHEEATWELMNITEESGLKAYIGKVCMDRNSVDELFETTEQSLEATERLAVRCSQELKNVKYILTPRFVPATSEKLMTGLAKIRDKYELPVQSHLSENISEINFVKELHPDIPTYTEVYEHYGLMPENQTIMAHCIHLSDTEKELLKSKNVYMAHCAQSNANLTSGIMPLRKNLMNKMNCVIASDVAAGNTVMMNRHIENTIQLSKINQTINKEEKAINLTEALYLATKAPGRFFGKVGSFEEDYEFDALVIDVNEFDGIINETITEKLEKFIYTGDDRNIVQRFCAGEKV